MEGLAYFIRTRCNNSFLENCVNPTVTPNGVPLAQPQTADPFVCKADISPERGIALKKGGVRIPSYNPYI